MNNKLLRLMFYRLNRKYFKGKLNCSVKFADLSESENDGQIIGDDIEIEATYRRSVSATELILLHELIHANGDIKGHGRKFHKEVNRLYKAGAYKGLL
jgi:hypothetical protein